ncbi:hypothetical protein DY218_16885 [Streptomyces triticagri]|uniref:SH3 domain-containing protein n=1 Tax=Streptomyces triticagri TaxID=2293568 RepID=A0A372M3K3_9ACTN|nr:hypothetical protein [Streptomyces triticagri]RFU85516.1 hypothetical protein DY218_16885 [Streptomyces triticagri]
MGAPPEVAGGEGVVGVKAGMCSGSPYNKRAKAIKKTVKLKKDYYNASPTVISVSYGTTMGYYDKDTNSHGNVWHKVQYSNIQNDWCGWVSDNWVELYYP